EDRMVAAIEPVPAGPADDQDFVSRIGRLEHRQRDLVAIAIAAQARGEEGGANLLRTLAGEASARQVDGARLALHVAHEQSQTIGPLLVEIAQPGGDAEGARDHAPDGMAILVLAGIAV